MREDIRPLRVAAVASKSEFGDKATNLGVILDWMEKAAQQSSDLVCFPEIALQGYCTIPRIILDLAEPIHGPHIETIRNCACRLGLVASVGMALRDERKGVGPSISLLPLREVCMYRSGCLELNLPERCIM